MQHAENKETCQHLLANCSEDIKLPRFSFPAGLRLIRVDERLDRNQFEIALIDTNSRYIVYYNRVTISEDVELKAKPATQVRVWRTPKREYRKTIDNLAHTVFFDYLLHSYTVIVTDSHQSSDGMNFWHSRIYDALEEGLHVYAYEQMTGKCTEMASTEDFTKIIDQVWSEREDAKFWLMAISKEKLPLGSEAQFLSGTLPVDF